MIEEQMDLHIFLRQEATKKSVEISNHGFEEKLKK